MENHITKHFTLQPDVQMVGDLREIQWQAGDWCFQRVITSTHETS
jgi:hypothetical protein